MRRIRVLKKGNGLKELGAIQALIVEAGLPKAEIEVIDEVGPPDPKCDDDIIIVVATPATCDDASLEAELAACQSGGRRVICVWPEDAPADIEPPVAAQKYAYSVVSWNAEKLRAVAADDDVLCFEKPNGEALPKPDTERNLCVDEKAPTQ